MTEAPKKIWAWPGVRGWYAAEASYEVNLGLIGPEAEQQSVFHHDAEVQRLVAEARAERVSVKPLVWEEDPRGGWRRGRVVGLSPSHKQEATIFRSEVGWQYMGDMYLSAHDSLDDALSRAKTAAQADYERRILSALSDAPPRQPEFSVMRHKTGNAVEVCGICDIADCKHIRERRAAELTELALNKDHPLMAPPRQVTPQEAAKVLLEADDYMPTTAKLAATKAHLGRDSKVQPVAIAEAWRAALRALANGGDSDE